MSPEASAPYSDSFLQRSELLRRTAFTLINATGLPWMVRHTLQRDRATIVLYHEIGPELFARQVGALQRRYNVIPLAQLVDFLEGRGDLPPRALVITFDDGHASNRSLLRILHAVKVPISVFLCSGIVGTRKGFWWSALPTKEGIHQLQLMKNRDRVTVLRERYGFDQTQEAQDRMALSDAEIGEMKGLVDFQSHTRTHPILTSCDDDEAKEEIAGSRRELRERHGIEVTALAYPDGYYAEREIRMSIEAGYRCALTLDAGYVHRSSDPFRLRRLCLSDDGGQAELLVKASGLWAFVRLFLNRAMRR